MTRWVWGMCLASACFTLAAHAGSVAFGQPGTSFTWQTAEKQGIGTAYEAYGDGHSFASSPTAPVSRVWFTMARGIVTEVYYPRVDIPQTRDTQLLVTDGRTFLHQEQYDMRIAVRRAEGSLLWSTTADDTRGRYRIEKQVWADPDSDTLVTRLRITRNVPGLRFYLLHKPAAANSLFHDDAERNGLVAGETNAHFTGWQALGATVAWGKTSVGYVGKSDGYTDLADNYSLDWQFDHAPRGNVALIGELSLPEGTGTTELTTFLAFAGSRDGAVQAAARAREMDVDASRRKFEAGWRDYLAPLDLPFPEGSPSERKSKVEHSLLVLKASEDKTFSGAVVASLSHPWGETKAQTEHSSPYDNNGYHVVWPRDLYHVAGGFAAAGDHQTIAAILKRLRAAQFRDSDGYWELGPRRQKKAGSFPQNFWVDGRAHWGGYQADQTAMPAILAYREWKAGRARLDEVWEMARAAADFLAEMGPWTQQERWEENHGISPNSAGYVIAALLVTSEMAFAKGDNGRGARFLALADQFSLKSGDNLEAWTFTTNGKIHGDGGDGRYYLRLDGAAADREKGGAPIWNAVWRPNEDSWLVIANTGGDARFRWESEVVDAGFLALVRLGVRAAKSHFVRESLPEVDAKLRRETPRGPGFYRYRYDGYGEEGRGRLWPFLTGERIHYDLQYLVETGRPERRSLLEPKLTAYESFANETGLFSEQVWDEGPGAGRPTGSATPLCWTHAEHLMLAFAVEHGKMVEDLPSVRARYGKH